MTPKLTADQRSALAQSAGQPVKVEDDQTHEVFFLVGQQALPGLWEQYIRREVQRGLDEIDRGQTVPWDMPAILEQARARHSNPNV